MSGDTIPPNDDFLHLVKLLETRSEVDAEIASIVGRSARPGDVGEYIAAHIFGIDLADTPTQAGYDGTFRGGPLSGKTVNVKLYASTAAGLDIGPHHCDYYLVLAGEPPPPGDKSPRGWRVSRAYLFETVGLHRDFEELDRQRGRTRKIGISTSVPVSMWQAAQVFPATDASPLLLDDRQIRLLNLLNLD